MIKLKRILGILLAGVMIFTVAAGLCSCGLIKSIISDIDSKKIIYIEGEIMYVLPRTNLHYVYILPDDPNEANPNKMLVCLVVYEGTNTESEFSSDIANMPELTVGNKIKATYQNNTTGDHFAIDFVPYTSELKTDEKLTPYEIKEIDSFDMSKLESSEAWKLTGTVEFVDRMTFDYMEVFIIHIYDDVDNKLETYFALIDPRSRMDDELWEKFMNGETGFKVSFLYTSTEAVDVPGLRYLAFTEIVE